MMRWWCNDDEGDDESDDEGDDEGDDEVFLYLEWCRW